MLQIPPPDYTNKDSIIGYLITFAFTTAVGIIIRSIERRKMKKKFQDEIIKNSK